IGITVLKMDEHRIARVRVSRGSRAEEGGGREAESGQLPSGEVSAADDSTADVATESDGNENIAAKGQAGSEERLTVPDAAGDDPDHKVVH
ncbi:MAG: hypothetical protein KJO10_01155, partial [Gammaproteobacteria bacterium]|nr:hypothetical protein [Gammaproteobacteria bacterium]